MRKFNTILLILICSLLTSFGHGKVTGKQAIDIPVIQVKKVPQNSCTMNTVMFYDDTLVPPLLILMVVPT